MLTEPFYFHSIGPSLRSQHQNRVEVKMATGKHLSFVVITIGLATCLYQILPAADCSSQFVESLNSGMQMSIPYDIANLFIRPIAASIAVFLSIALWFILVFGVITSPFGYMFGIPSRKYVLGGPIDIAHSQVASRQDAVERARSLESFDISSLFDAGKWNRTKFQDSMLFYLPEEEEGRYCNHLLLCYSHGVFQKMPSVVLKVYRFFGRRLLQGDEKTTLAIKTGLGGADKCDDMFPECDYSRFKLAVKVFKSLLPG